MIKTNYGFSKQKSFFNYFWEIKICAKNYDKVDYLII